VINERHNWIKHYVLQKTPYYLRENCEDITQDAMIKLLKADKRKDIPITNYGYYRQTVMSVMIDYIRKHKSSKALEDNFENSDLTNMSSEENDKNPELLAYQQLMLDQVYKIINSFDEDRQTALLLYLRGLKIKEIAKMTGSKISKVRNEVYRGKEKILKTLNAQGIYYEV